MRGNDEWWKLQPRSQPASSADARLRNLYSSIDNAIGHLLALRLLSCGTPLIIFRPVGGEAPGMSWHHCGKCRCH
jgi:hypothetical protein